MSCDPRVPPAKVHGGHKEARILEINVVMSNETPWFPDFGKVSTNSIGTQSTCGRDILPTESEFSLLSLLKVHMCMCVI